jgi:clan AA aspartic protease
MFKTSEYPNMGEVRVKTILRNAGEEFLVRRGRLPKDDVHEYEADALVDPGAVSLIVPSFVVERLGLQLVGKKNAELANGSIVTLDVTEPVDVHIDGRTVTLEALMTGNEVLIGQMVLEATDMQVDCMNRRVIPNPAHPDQPVLKLK